VTQQTLADDLGVSLATISNAYNRPAHVSSALRERIFRRAKALGYSGPHAGARSLRVGKASAVGLIFTEELPYAFGDPAITAFLEGVSASLAEAQMSLLIIPSGRIRTDMSIVRNALVDAFLLYSTPKSDPAIVAAQQRNVPLVCVDAPRLPGAPFVSIDDRAAARAAAEHVIAQGHARLAVLIADATENRAVRVTTYEDLKDDPPDVTRARLYGYADACAEHGLPMPMILQAGFNTVDSVREALHALHPRLGNPTALLATSDLLAVGAMKYCDDVDIRVPHDVSVVGFDDLSLLTDAAPTLTTVRQPLREKGALAGQLLVSLINGKKMSKLTHDLPWELVERGSTGPA